MMEAGQEDWEACASVGQPPAGAGSRQVRRKPRCTHRCRFLLACWISSSRLSFRPSAASTPSPPEPCCPASSSSGWPARCAPAAFAAASFARLANARSRMVFSSASASSSSSSSLLGSARTSPSSESVGKTNPVCQEEGTTLCGFACCTCAGMTPESVSACK